MQFGLKVRVGLTLSAIWICVVALSADTHQSAGTTFGLAALPLAVLWGLGWSIAGWLEKRKSETNSEDTAKGGRLLPALKYAGLVLTVVVVGVVGAHWYASLRNAEAVKVEIARLAGEWMVYSALAYVAFRLVPGYTRKSPGLLTALVFVVGLNYSSHKQIDLFVNTRQSLAASTPIFVKIQAGEIVGKEEIKAANVGLFEPFLLAASDASTRLVVAQKRYEKAVAESGLAEAMGPTNLALPGGRVKAKLVISNVERVTSEYLIEAEAAFKSGKVSVKSVVLQMPKEFAPVFKEYEQKADQSLAHLQKLREVEEALLRCAHQIVDAVDADPGQVKVSAGPQPLLLFSNDATAKAYNELVGRFGDLAKQEAQLNEKVMRERVETVDRITNSLNVMN